MAFCKSRLANIANSNLQLKSLAFCKSSWIGLAEETFYVCFSDHTDGVPTLNDKN